MFNDALRPLVQSGSVMCTMTKELKKQRDRIPTTMPQAQQLVQEVGKAEALAMLVEYGKANVPKVMKYEFDPIVQNFYQAQIRLERVITSMLHGGWSRFVISDRKAAQEKLISFFDELFGLKDEDSSDEFEEDTAYEDDEYQDSEQAESDDESKVEEADPFNERDWAEELSHVQS